MFSSVRIQNFRLFRDLKLQGLSQINLITGANDTGKTSLLEALFLLDNPLDPSRTVTVARFRGLDQFSSETPELWEWLFNNRDTSRPIEIDGTAEDGHRTGFKATISRGSLIPALRNGDPTSPVRSAPRVTSTEPLPALVYDLSPSGDERRIDLRWTSQGLVLDPDSRLPGRQGFFLPDYHRSGPYDAVRFSRVEAAGRAAAVIEALRFVEPRLQKLTVLDLGEGSRVYADLGQPPLTPLAMMGQGFSRLLTIIAAIAIGESPIMLVDEIESGFHYTTLPDVWRAITSAAIQHSAQIFATTYSWECVEAAVKACEGQEGKLALFRLERHKADIRAVDVEREDLRVAVGLGVELR